MAKFLIKIVPPLPFRPPTRNVSSGRPACGTSFISIPRFVPTNTTSLSLPRDIHSRAIASAGKTCPPVPPPAIKSFITEALDVGGHSKLRVLECVASPSRLSRLLPDVQEHARGQ